MTSPSVEEIAGALGDDERKALTVGGGVAEFAAANAKLEARGLSATRTVVRGWSYTSLTDLGRAVAKHLATPSQQLPPKEQS